KELKLDEIEQEMLQKVQDDSRANSYGIDVKFLGIKKLGLPESVTQLVFERMQSERKLQEDQIKFEGEQQANEIRTAADLKSAKIVADAEAESTRIRGQGDAVAAKTFKVFEQEPDLANFLIELTGLENFLKERAILILDPRTPPLNLLRPQAPPTGGTK